MSKSLDTLIDDMACDTEDQVIPLKELSDQPFMPRRHGKKIHRSTFYRWISKGIGPQKIRLATVKCGGMRGVRLSALKNFFSQLNNKEKLDSPTSNRKNKKLLQHVENELKKAGF